MQLLPLTPRHAVGEEATVDLEEMAKSLVARNDSLLAHGFTPIAKEGYERVRNLAGASLLMLSADWEPTVERLRFPTLDRTVVTGSVGAV